LQCKKISITIEGNCVLDNIDFTLKPKQHLLVLGASGCGKTTLLSILAGLKKPDIGTICYDDKDLYSLSETERDYFRGEQLGILFQTFHLVKILTVRQNLLLAQSLPGKPVDESRIYNVLNRLGLADKSHQNVAHLSVGEAQRLAVARAVIGNPKWILCDEPTSALDDDNAKAMLNLLEEEASRCKASLVVVTHDKRVTSFFDKKHILMLGGKS
ncbi:MAG: ABC transporter ATP-binding protein, partial [Parvibaculales bacterium]